MSRALDTQTFGSVVVIGAFIAAEAAAFWLMADPSSPLAWYVNIELFHPFEMARTAASPLRNLFGPSLLPAAVCALVVALALRAWRLHLGVALVANVSFVCAVAVAYTWLGATGAIKAASLRPVIAAQGHDALLMALMLASSFAAFAMSHLSFVARIASDRHAPAAPR